MTKQLLTPGQLHEYQKECVMHQLQYDDSMLWLGMGLGKTAITLTSIVDRMRSGTVKKTLICGPLRVIQAVWAREAKKWEHSKHLRFSILHGNKDKRTRALFADADIFLVNYEGLNWLAEQLDHYYISQGKPFPFDMVVYDEVSKLKNSTTKRMKGGTRDRKDKWGTEHKIKITGWRKIIPHFKYRTGLTGTPASNGYLDLHGQYLAVDGGERLGEFITHFKDSYFMSDYSGWKYTPTELGKQFIEEKISDITKKMDANDYLDLPDCKVTNLLVDLPIKARKAYDEVEKDMFAELDSGAEIEVFSRSAVSNKCLQFCLAEGTEVLTDSGWKPIEQFQKGDKVWDGIEWVNVYSLAFQGRKTVVELDGVWMTPDHKVLTDSGWKEACEVLNGDASEGFNRTSVRLPDGFGESGFHNRKAKESNVACTLRLWKRVQSNWSELTQSPKTWCQKLWLPTRGDNNQCDGFARNVTKEGWQSYEGIHHLDKHAFSMSQPEGQGLPELRWSRDTGVRRMVRFIQSFLGRHAGWLSESFNDRTIGQRWGLSCGQLQMGNSEQTVKQQTEQHIHHDTVGSNDSDTGCTSLWVQGCDVIRSYKERMARRRLVVTSRIEKTYDLINAGKRNRFTVRGVNGEIFIAHNCNGSPYLSSESPEFEVLHDAKLDALEEVLEEAGGSPVLCSYSFKSDAERIMKRFKKYNPVNMTAAKSADTEKIINKWNNGGIKLMIGHPASMGHGVDGLQESGCILVWFGCNWSLELYEQMNGRINRQGQNRPVSIIRIICADTVDLAVVDALERKTDDQEGLKNALQRYRSGITTNDLEVNFF